MLEKFYIFDQIHILLEHSLQYILWCGKNKIHQSIGDSGNIMSDSYSYATGEIAGVVVEFRISFRISPI